MVFNYFHLVYAVIVVIKVKHTWLGSIETSRLRFALEWRTPIMEYMF